MSNNWFRFREFMVKQDRCAMKVGTDGVLLGAWCDAANYRKILDAGTGTGIIALMCAQRSLAAVTGIEIDPEAAAQAGENFKASPWSSRLKMISGDLRRSGMFDDMKFDMIVSNPPYYDKSLLAKGNERNIARHNIGSSLAELIDILIKALLPDGKISLIIPASRYPEMKSLFTGYGFYLHRHAGIASRPGEKDIRVMAEWTKYEKEVQSSQIYIYKPGSDEIHPFYQNLTRDFYL